MLTPFPLEIVVHEGQYYLVNASACPVQKLDLCIGLNYIDPDGGTRIDAEVPHYELTEVPAFCHVPINVPDTKVEAIVWWRAEEVLWGDGRCDEGIMLEETQLWSDDPPPGTRMNQAPALAICS